MSHSNITQLEIFNFIKDNLTIELDVNEKLVGGVCGYNRKEIKAILKLKSPETDKIVTVSEYEIEISE